MLPVGSSFPVLHPEELRKVRPIGAAQPGTPSYVRITFIVDIKIRRLYFRINQRTGIQVADPHCRHRTCALTRPFQSRRALRHRAYTAVRRGIDAALVDHHLNK